MVTHGCMQNFVVLLILFFSAQVSVEGHEEKPSRKVTSKFECLPKAVNVAHTKAVGKIDTLHYIISSVGTPAILVAKTHLNVNVTINCEKMLSDNRTGAIEFDKPPLYVYALLLNRVLEYNDVDDKASLNDVSQNHTSWNITNLSSLTWYNSTLTSDLEQNIITLKVNTSSKTLDFTNNGSLSFRFKIYGTEGRQEELPHLAYTKNSAEFDFTLDHVKTTFDKSRFALEMAFVTVDKNSTDMGIVTTKSIDDEHTPGVFELFDWVSNKNNEHNGSYVQWKPICYTLPKRAITAITKAKSYDVKFNISKGDLGSNNLAYMYFGDTMFSTNIALTMTNVSFGLAKDKFYNLNQFSVWSAGVGVGQPPEDTVSTTIIIVILCGVGIPAALIIFGGIAVCVKKRRDRYKGYQDLSDSDVTVNT